MAPGRVGPSPVPIFSSLLFFLAGLASIYSLELKIGDIVTKQYPPIVNMRCTIPLLSLLPVVVILSSWMTMNLVSAAPLEVDLDVFHHQHAQSESLLHRRQIESGGENVPGGGGTTGGGGDDEIITMTRKELDMYAVLHVNWGTLIQQCVDRKAAEVCIHFLSHIFHSFILDEAQSIYFCLDLELGFGILTLVSTKSGQGPC